MFIWWNQDVAISGQDKNTFYSLALFKQQENKKQFRKMLNSSSQK